VVNLPGLHLLRVVQSLQQADLLLGHGERVLETPFGQELGCFGGRQGTAGIEIVPGAVDFFVD
jgi:hypothetical protein